MKLQLLPLEEILTPNSTNPKSAEEFINSYIDRYHCKNMSVDISCMNIPDACYVSTMCSTKHYLKYPDGCITWKVSSGLIRDFNKNMELGNSIYVE